MGKSYSKLKKKERDQGAKWSSSLLRSTSQKKMYNKRERKAAKPHMEISLWLTNLELSQYNDNFKKYSGVEDLLDFSEAKIKELGVLNSAHRARIVSSLVVLKEKYKKFDGEKSDMKFQRHSVAADNGKLTVYDEQAADSVFVSNVVHSSSLSNIRMEASSNAGLNHAELRKILEWELSLDARDLRSHAWYHGSIPRSRAEEILESDGDFLVRDCTSQPGNYVLSTKCKNQNLHFVINKVVLQPDTVYERIQFQFEDEAYDTVSDLITYYVGSGKVISSLSGARIQNPKNRLQPLSFYAAKYDIHHSGYSATPMQSPALSSGNWRYNTISPHGNHFSFRQKQDSTSSTLSNKQRSLSLTPELNGKQQFLFPGNDKSNSADGIIQNTKSNSGKFATNSLPRGVKNETANNNEKVAALRTCKMSRVTSDPTLSPCFERRKDESRENEKSITDAKSPPPKPSRIPSLPAEVETNLQAKESGLFRGTSYQAYGSDSGNGSGDSAQSSAPGDTSEAVLPSGVGIISRGVVIKNPRYHCNKADLSASASASTLKEVEVDPLAEEDILKFLPKTQLSSVFDVENFQTLLLPTLENKPVDSSTLQCVKNMLYENGSRVLANHMTKIDLEIIVYQKSGVKNWDEQSLGLSSGIEMCALPHGQQVRLDIIERVECLKLFVAVTILTCKSETERAETLHKWIQVAIDIKTALGNLFGFAAIMLGLCLPQVQRLAATWHTLRQKFTDSAFNYEAKLRPTLKSMNECTDPQAPNTTIPYFIPFILLQELTLDDVLGVNSKSNSSLAGNCFTVFESSLDFGLSTMFSHLESGRKFSSMLPYYRRNAEIILGDSKIDDLILDMFRTEFHLKFLWGSRGAAVCFEERHAKFDQVLTVMSEKCEPSSEISKV